MTQEKHVMYDSIRDLQAQEFLKNKGEKNEKTLTKHNDMIQYRIVIF